ncbi:5'-methylthioadenosine/S-adenosylhomocysteine nucleosidase family protein [Sphingomicrobium aestuariivivum]|uniref:5'-methylthioadenosine/S-adenosylhomocysteine nucleosidase family protein n=1 Tax=Sphingomicrobium aestuariivivum TaxID=1582356 RepID=UPI001FD6398E|nr:5'-methylthioadenosine/S-adenosylhomocysteine nucleosidase [Sphingomicrobium aestuariivivum]MCJ8191088.1 5'-methylthioadenosine/S-adenosylhomocysteine nucleosidase [Sphingomicrobium aestuariivivum]
MRVGIITGLIEEADSFRPGEGRPHRGVPFYCREGDNWIVACAGVGKVNAAMACTYLIDKGIDCLISMGVAGRIGSGREQVYWTERAFQHDYGAWRRSAFVAFRAGTMPIGSAPLEALEAMTPLGIDLPRATILTGDSFIDDRERSDQMAKRFKAELVDMETGALAQVAEHHRIPWGGIRAVSDAASGEGVAEFEANLNRAAQRAAEAGDHFVRAAADA